MSNKKKYPKLEIHKKIVASPGLRNIAARVLDSFSTTSLTVNIQADVIIEKYWKVVVGDK